MAERIVIVGNGMAGATAIEEILKIKPGLPITVFGEEKEVNYNRILLSDVLAGKKGFEEIVLNPREWYEKNGIDLRAGVRVAMIDRETESVHDESGAITPYGRLILATGAHPHLPKIGGLSKPGVFVFRNIEDTERIIARAQAIRKSRYTQAVVIGGGLLGLEAARGLINYGVEATIVHLTDRLMEQQLDATAAAMLKLEIERLGIEVVLQATAEEILGDAEVEAVRLATGRILPAGMVLVCAGVRPDLELARAAGIATARGILVDDRMETSVPGIFALGDAAEHRGIVYGVVAPIRAQARAVADAIAGSGELRFAGTPCATILKVAGVQLTSGGEFETGPNCEETIHLDTRHGVYKKLVFRDRRPVGMILLGDNRDGQRLFNLILKGEPVPREIDLLGGVAAAIPAAATESETICNCNNVTRGMIVSAIREKGLTSREQIAVCTKATTGCGTCADLVDGILKEVRLSLTPAASKAAPSPAEARASLKTLDLEKIKQEGLGIDFERVRQEGTRALSSEDYYRLKTYGVCSQKHPGYFMLRIRIPGGEVTARQLARLSELAETHGRGSGHLTVRQDLELHWVRVEEVPQIWERLEEVGLSTRSACGHTLRNVTACHHGAVAPDAPFDVVPWARAVTDYFVKRSDLINPRMPNRLNVFFAACGECAPEAQINDIGFVAKVGTDPGGASRLGFELWVGGSLGPHPMLGFVAREFILPEEVLPACQAVFAIHTKFGNRTKARSRLKFLIEEWGREEFLDRFEKIFAEKKALPENREFVPPQRDPADPRPPLFDRLISSLSPIPAPRDSGSLAQRQAGYLRLAIDVPLGEIRASQLAAVGRIARRYGNGVAWFTRSQGIELEFIPRARARAVIRALARAGLSLSRPKGSARIVACPGTEFCVLAVTNAQGAAREIRGAIEQDLDPRFYAGISIHISGCPNNCAKHHVGDIGLAGTMAAVGEERRFSYQLYLGGKVEGGVRLGEMVRKGITEEQVVPTIRALLSIVAEQRPAGESFSEVVSRLTPARIGELLGSRIGSPQPTERVGMIPDLVEVNP